MIEAVTFVQSLRNGLRILKQFSEVNGELTVTEIATQLQMSKSQVSRMLAACREEGWVTQNPVTRGFSVGIAAYTAGMRFIDGNRLARETLPILRAVVDRCGFTCTLSVLEGTRPLYLLGIEGSISADVASRVGSYFHYHATASGKLLTAFADEPVRAAMLRTKPVRLTPQTKVDSGVLRRELRDIRERGYAVSIAERVAGIGAIAVPVFGAQGICLGALGIAYPLSLVSSDKYPYYAGLLHLSARDLSLRMGAGDYRFTSQAETPEQRAETTFQP
ncbi:MAG: IclR family transcriptional regulator [Burkholderiaceae bacterium]